MSEKEDSLVVKASRLMAASYQLSVVEQRLLLMVATKRGDMSREFTITAAEYAEKFHTTEPTAYEALKEARNRLFNRSVTWHEGEFVFTSRWVSYVAYGDGVGAIKLHLTPPIQPMMGQLSSAFTAYHLDKVSGITSAYGVRLYEILVAWKAKSSHRLELENLRQMLGVPDGAYGGMSDFKRHVLDLAVTQVNQYTDMRVRYEQHKAGRTIVAFTFHFVVKDKPKAAPAKAPARDGDTFDFVNGATDNQVKAITLTDKQAGYFAALLAKDFAFMSMMGKGKSGGYCHGMDERAALAQIARDIRTPAPEVVPFLRNAGYKG